MTTSAPFTAHSLTLTAEPLNEATGPVRLVWLHGWGQDKESLRPLAHALLRYGEGWLIDLPGHGTAPNPPPDTEANPAALARLLAAWLGTLPTIPTILIGHSMGFRVAIHAAAQSLPQLKGMVALAGAGVPRVLPLALRVRRMGIRALMRGARALKPVLGDAALNALRARFGSRDYTTCPRALRPMFIQMVQDDVTALLGPISTPALLLYGAQDEDTPPDVGHRFKRGLKHAELHVLAGMNHHTVLTQGRHVCANLMERWLKGLSGRATR